MARETEPERLVRAFLAHLEARELDAARALTGPGFTMTFPGGAVFADFADLLAWAAPRYRFVRKTIERMEVSVGGGGGAAVVWCFGTLAGEWPDGAPFAGIRFADRLEIAAGRIVDQKVWNDLGEARAGRAP